MNYSPSEYAKANILAAEVGKEMIGRLDWMTLQPRIIIDMGCGTGELSLHLQSRYEQALILGLDHSESMVEYAKRANHPSSSPAYLCADVGKLPLQDQCADLIFANFLFPWQKEITPLLREWRRILRPEGLLMFTAFGPDTLHPVFSSDELPERIDMHVMGDQLLAEGFSDPVLDVDYYTMTYSTKEKLLAECYASGMLKSLAPLTETNLIAAEDGKWHAKYEIIYAHAFKPTTKESSSQEDGLVRIPLNELRKQLKSK